MNLFRRKQRWRGHWVVETWQWRDIRRHHPEFVGAVFRKNISDTDLMSRQDPDAWGWDILWAPLTDDEEKMRKILSVLGENREMWRQFGDRFIYSSLLGLPVEAGGRGPGTQDWRTNGEAARIVAEAWADYLWSRT